MEDQQIYGIKVLWTLLSLQDTKAIRVDHQKQERDVNA